MVDFDIQAWYCKIEDAHIKWKLYTLWKYQYILLKLFFDVQKETTDYKANGFRQLNKENLRQL